MNMVRRTLLEAPDVTDRALYAAAIALEPSIGTLSLKQFQARYPRRVRRLEIGAPTSRAREPGASHDELPLADRPQLYAPGQDTLVHASSDPHQSQAGVPVSGDATPPGSRTRRVRRSVLGVPAGSEADEAAGQSEGTDTGIVEGPEAATTGSEPSASTSMSEPPQPWPLRLHPEAAGRLPAPHLRLVRAGADSARAVKGRRHQRSTGSESRRSPVERSPTPSEARSGQEAAKKAPPPLHRQESGPPQDTLAGKRDRLRRVLLDWAREIAEAETRGQLVGALARAGEYVNEITRIAGIDATLSESPVTTAFQQAPERPDLPRRRRIAEYDPEELDALVRWVAQTEPGLEPDDLVARVCRELGFKRRGRQIVAGVRQAVERVLATE